MTPLKGLFGGTDLERQLEEHYTGLAESLMGLSAGDARKVAREQLRQAQEQIRLKGGEKLPERLGDLLLEREETDTATRTLLAKRRTEGVADEDIRWWWNMHDLDRQMMIASDNTARTALFISVIQETGSPEKGAERVRQFFPMYGDPEDSSNVSGEDRLLPYELKDRVNTHTQRHMMPDAENAKTQLARYSSYNAFLRQELKEERL